jgi:hypothetical protein
MSLNRCLGGLSADDVSGWVALGRGGPAGVGRYRLAAGEIVIAGKARRRDRLPLPHDVGQALSAYLRDVRLATSIRAMF